MVPISGHKWGENGAVHRLGVIVAMAATLAAPAGAGVPARAVPASPSPVAPDRLCTFDDPRVVELSGLVATATGYVAINDGNDDPDAIRIFYFDRACALTRTVGYPTVPRDPEDLALAPDGTLWVADIGDNASNGADHRRETIALWRLAPGGVSPPVLHRLSYPDGPHDAETLLLNGDGSPVIVTKELSGTSGIYVPSGPLQPNATVALRKVGTFTPKRTGTANFLGLIGQVLVTGGGQAPDGTRVVLRTYSDAYEFDVADSDVVRAITTGTPRITALPDEPQGESIAYTPDGAGLLTVSDATGATPLLRYPSLRPRPSAGTASGSAVAQWLSAGQAGYLVAAAVGLVLLMVAAAALVIRRSRPDRPAQPPRRLS